MERLLNISIGAASIGTIEAVNSIPSPDQIIEIGKIIIQIIIGVVTIWGIFKPKTTKEKERKEEIKREREQ